MKPPPLPTALNTDAQWAAVIRWLQFHGLRVHIPRVGDPWFERLDNPRQFAQ